MKVEEVRCWEVHLLIFHARKVINCISKPESQGITSKMVWILLGWCFGVLLLWDIVAYFLFLHDAKMKTLSLSRQNSVKRSQVMTDHQLKQFPPSFIITGLFQCVPLRIKAEGCFDTWKEDKAK